MKRAIAALLILANLINFTIPVKAFSAGNELSVSSSISVTSNIDGALIYIDGEEVGTTPLGAPIITNPGTHAIKVKKEGYSTWRQNVILSTGEDLTLIAPIVPLDTAEPEAVPTERVAGQSTITVTANVTGASVYLNGEEVGITPLTESIKAAPGTYIVEIKKDGHTTWEKEFMLAPDENISLNTLIVPLEAPAAKVQRPKKPIHKRWWFWVLALAAVGAAFSGGGDAGPGTGDVEVTGPNF